MRTPVCAALLCLFTASPLHAAPPAPGRQADTLTTPNGKKLPLHSAYESLSGNGNPYAGEKLYLVKRSDSAKTGAAKTMLFLLKLAGTGSAHQQGSSKYDLTGSPLDVDNRHLPVFYAGIKELIGQHYAARNAVHDYTSLSVTGKRTFLIYEHFNPDPQDLHRLVQVYEIGKVLEYGSDRRSIRITCEQNHAVKPLAEWQADDYRLVHETSAQYAHNCVDEIRTRKLGRLDFAYEQEQTADEAAEQTAPSAIPPATETLKENP